MVKVKGFNQDGSQNGDVELNEAIFGIEPNQSVVFDALVAQRASQRQGTHSVKNRSAVAGGGRKPWRQKGTGRARAGSNTSPIWRGGGVIFGPTPERNYSQKLPKKVRRLAIKSALSQKVMDEEVAVIDSLSFEQAKTKEFRALLDAIGADRKALVVLEDGNEKAQLAARNIQGVKVVAPTNVSVLDVVDYDKLIFTKSALEQVEEALN